MRSEQWFPIAIVSMILVSWSSSASATTIQFLEDRTFVPGTPSLILRSAPDTTLTVLEDGTLLTAGNGLVQGTVSNETAQVVSILSFPSFVDNGLRGVATFQAGIAPGSVSMATVSDFVLADVTGTAPSKATVLRFESDPNILFFSSAIGPAENNLLQALITATRTGVIPLFVDADRNVDISNNFMMLKAGTLVPAPLPTDLIDGPLTVLVTSDIPEPSTLLLLTSGLAGLVLFGRRRFLRRA